MLPFGWTAGLLLEAYASKPYNPDIARVFYCAGYIESWGRGIQKIRDACKKLGADDPEYIVSGGDIMVKFTALQSAKVPDSKTIKHQSTSDFGALDDALVQKILDVLRHKPEISQGEMAEKLGTTRRVIQNKMLLLKDAGCIERKGGKRYGYWEIHEL